MTSPDLVAGNVEKLAALFPQVITESADANGHITRAIDFDLLRQELSNNLVEGPKERFRLEWPGKRTATLVANAPIAKTLRPVREDSVNFDTTENLFIEGDNLEALKLLQESYLGKVKLIYIDPPYNTGRDFVYNDDFAESTEEYLKRSGQVTDEGERLVANPESNGRFHSDWLSMIYPRLRLARNLLTEDGAILISIDDAEFGNAQAIAKEVFGSQNFVGTFVWSGGRKNDSRFISSSHEYVICFARDLAFLKEQKDDWKVRKEGLDDIYSTAAKYVKETDGNYEAATAKLKAWYNDLPLADPARRNKHYKNVDEAGVYFPDNISWPGGGGPRYEVLHPKTGLPVTIPSRGWLFQKSVLEQKIIEGRVVFGDDESKVPTYKRYLHETEFEAPYSVLYQDGRAATKRVKALFDGDKVFDFPKDETILKRFIQMIAGEDEIVMDFFAGSSSTAHAVMELNAEDGGNRKFVMVQIPEETSEKSVARAVGYSTISGLSRERIRRAGHKVEKDFAEQLKSRERPLDIGFRSLRVDSLNMNDVLATPDEVSQSNLFDSVSNVKAGRTGEDLLFQVLLDWGLPLDVAIEIESIEGQECFVIEGGALIACFEPSVSAKTVRSIAKREPMRAVFRDEGFASDAERINAEQVFKEFAPAADVKVI